MIIASMLAVLLGAWVLPGVTVDSAWSNVLLVAVVIALLNAFVRPLLIFLTIPATIVTLGLFLLVINAGIIMIADSLLDGFSVSSFWWALLFSFILSIINSILGRAEKQHEYRD